jgi:hypothetical protein
MGAKLLFRLKLGPGFWLADWRQRDAGHNPDANLKLSQGFESARWPTASGSALGRRVVSAKILHPPN